jgi:hypothetical protein
MKRYSGFIRIEIPVNEIAQKLGATISDDCKHKDQIIDAIILAGIEAKTLHFLHNALNGFTNELDFTPGDTVMCEETAYFRDKPGANSEEHVIGEAVVVSVNPYRLDRKIRVEYKEYTSRGEESRGSSYVDHTKCSRIPTRLEETEKEETVLTMQP